MTFTWRNAPASIQNIGKEIAQGRPTSNSFRGIQGLNLSIDGLGIGEVFSGIFGGGSRRKIAIERSFQNTSQIDIHSIRNIRKVHWDKTGEAMDDGGRVRVLVAAPGSRAEGEDGEQGYPAVKANWELGYGERVTEVRRLGNVVVIIYPTHVEPGNSNTLYYHLEWTT